MAEVLVTLKVMPEDAGTDLGSMESEIKKLREARFNGVEKEPIAFGLVALKPSFVMDDAEGATEKLEEALRQVKGVGGVEVVQVTRLL
ncbi:MAG: elongation factor 1-beta [Candidatus Hydrothermarchaeota archaeon]